MLKASVIGATGYAGVELCRILLTHPQANIHRLSSVSFTGKAISEVYPALRGLCDERLVSEDEAIDGADVVFASLPAGLSEPIARKCLQAGALFIDLGADFRLHDPDAYESWYQKKYEDPELHGQAVYALPELFREEIEGARLLGNPGCYPTSVALGLAPVLKGGLIGSEDLIIDAKSGATGAGRGLSQTTHFCACNEGFAPYKVACHRHIPEIEQTLSILAGKPVAVTFVPHLLPVSRGIVSTIYAKLKGGASLPEVRQRYLDFYESAPFVRVLPEGEVSNLRNVRCSNYCDISLHLDAHTGRLIVVSAIDNMVKGAAGQAVQNMNIALGLDETAGLLFVPPAI